MGGEGSGGKRKGAGRPEGPTAEPSQVIALRLPVSWVEAIKNSHNEGVSVWLKEVAYNEALIWLDIPKKKQRKPTKAKPQKERVKRAQCSPNKPACKLYLEGAACSVEAPLFVPSQKGGEGIDRITARYCLVEIADLKTSHNPLTGFGARQGYPKEAQERDYRLPAEERKVRKIAEDYAPELIFSTAPGALDGLPIVTQERIVLGGNGRTMATVLVYNGEGGVPSDTPKNYLAEHAKDFGFTKAQVLKFKWPMVVRTIETESDVKTLAEWSRRLNASLSQQLDSTRLAVSRARFVDERVFSELANMSDDETLTEFLSSMRSKGFVRALQDSNVLDQRSAAQYLGYDGILTQKGRELVADLLVAVLLPDADLLQALGVGRVATLARSASYIVQTQTLGAYDLVKPIRKALRDRVSMLSGSYPTVKAFLKEQGSTLFAETSSATRGDPLAVLLLRVLAELDDSPVKLAKVTRRYLKIAKAPGGGQSALFASESFTPTQALQLAAKEEAKLDLSASVGAKPTKKK
jgi:hypothetical protein